MGGHGPLDFPGRKGKNNCLGKLPASKTSQRKAHAMTKSTNTALEPKKQLPIDHKKAHELSAKILGHLQLSTRYAELAFLNDEIYDNKGFVLAVESFLDHARDTSKLLKELQKARGILE